MHDFITHACCRKIYKCVYVCIYTCIYLFVYLFPSCLLNNLEAMIPSNNGLISPLYLSVFIPYSCCNIEFLDSCILYNYNFSPFDLYLPFSPVPLHCAKLLRTIVKILYCTLVIFQESRFLGNSTCTHTHTNTHREKLPEMRGYINLLNCNNHFTVCVYIYICMY
jgi:hypothetical protein